MHKQTIIEAIESTDYMIPHIPGFLEYLSIAGLKACVTVISDPAANRVSNAHLTEDNVADVVAHIYQYYSSRNLAFSWVVGPNTTPRDIESHLVKVGMKKTISGSTRQRRRQNCGTAVERPGGIGGDNGRSVPDVTGVIASLS